MIFLSWAHMALGYSALNPFAASDDDERNLEALFLTLSAGCEPAQHDAEQQIFRNWLPWQRISRCIDFFHLYRIHWSLHMAVMLIATLVPVMLGHLDMSSRPNYVFARGRRMCRSDKTNIFCLRQLRPR